MKICPKCGDTPISVEETVYCCKDGTRLVEQDVHSCGRRIWPSHKFCPQCGKKIEKAAA